MLKYGSTNATNSAAKPPTDKQRVAQAENFLLFQLYGMRRLGYFAQNTKNGVISKQVARVLTEMEATVVLIKEEQQIRKQQRSKAGR